MEHLDTPQLDGRRAEIEVLFSIRAGEGVLYAYVIRGERPLRVGESPVL